MRKRKRNKTPRRAVATVLSVALGASLGWAQSAPFEENAVRTGARSNAKSSANDALRKRLDAANAEPFGSATLWSAAIRANVRDGSDATDERNDANRLDATDERNDTNRFQRAGSDERRSTDASGPDAGFAASRRAERRRADNRNDADAGNADRSRSGSDSGNAAP